MAEQNQNQSGGNPEQTLTFTQDGLNAMLAREKGTGERSVYKLFGVQSKDEAEKLAQKLSGVNLDDIATLQTNYANVSKELADIKNQKVLAKYGVAEDDSEYYLFKINKLVNDNTTFEKAAEQYFKDNPVKKSGVRVDFSVPGEGDKKTSGNDLMNDIIRGAFK